MAALAALPHVAVKISGMGFAWRPWDIEQARPYVLETNEIFGSDRAMVASNFPTDKLFGSFDQHLSTYDAITISEERRVGKKADSTVTDRSTPDHEKKNTRK